jgi:hypothetical protein
LLALSPLFTLLSFAPAIALFIVLLVRLFDGLWANLSFVGLAGIDLLLAVLGVFVLVLLSGRRAFFVTIPGNRFGFSTGRAPAGSRLPGVTDWLYQELQEVAGRKASDAPLTFGDLWCAGSANGAADAQLKAAAENAGLRSINLQMMTTALTHGHPYRLPFENHLFSFRESELREYFPKEVVDHMVAKARKRDAGDTGPATFNDLHALPEPWDLPVVVAVRMSLSFPLLFTMVPLYGVDFTLKANQGGTRNYERCWFIDGGLSSNFPMSLFDSPFPRWPTFGINLGDFPPDHPKDPHNEENNVWMVSEAGAGTSNQWTRFPDLGTGAIGGYVGAMLDTIRNWHDNTQLAVPGFRDRVALVKLTPDEGGLNLDMDATKVESLSKRGLWAGRRFRERFGVAGAHRDPLNWNSHRWTRYKTSMALLQKTFRGMHEAFSHSDPDYPSYDDLLARTSDAAPKTGLWWKGRRDEYLGLTREFRDLAQKASASTTDFDSEAPRPKPELRTTPRL